MNPNLIHQNEKFPNELLAYIEVQKNTRTKYEYDEKMQTLVLDRILHSAVFYFSTLPKTLMVSPGLFSLDSLRSISFARLPKPLAKEKKKRRQRLTRKVRRLL